MSFFVRKNIFDILREAEEDEQESTPDTQEDTTPSDDSAETDDTSTEDSGDDYGEDEDFNIDTELDDDMGNDGEDSGDTGSSPSTDTNTSSGSSPEMSDDEPVKSNTDIFSSLSAEEQTIKIKELKSMYKDLYNSCNDILVKINDIDPDEDNMEIINRVSITLYSLKQYIADYLTNLFAQRSYIENDIAFNRFLSILNSISTVINDINKVKEEKIGKSDKK